jgi:hypothetical protein
MTTATTNNPPASPTTTRPANPLSNLNPLNAMKKAGSNSKVKKIALEVLKTLGIALLAAGLCAVSFASFGLAWLIGGTIAGGLLGGIAYIAIRSVYLTVRKEGFPSYRYKTAAPIDQETWLGDDQKKDFRRLLGEEFGPKEWFKEWKRLHAFRSDKELERYLWLKIQKNARTGEAVAMLQAGKEHGKLKGERFLKKIEAEEVYRFQILTIIEKALRGFVAAAFADDVRHLLKHPPSGVRRGVSFELDALSLAHFDKFYENLKTHVFEAERPARAALAPELVDAPFEAALLHPSSHPPAAPLFIQFKPELRFYDSSHKKFSGLHEGFKTEEEFAKALFRHFRGYQSKLRPKSPKFKQVLVELYS